MLAAAPDLDALAVALPALLGHRDGDRAGEVLASDALAALHDLLGRALRDDIAAVDAGAGAEVHDVVRGAQGLLVVLDDDQGVADVAQVDEGVDKFLVVPLVQADRGLVEDVEDPDEGRSDLRREAYALGLAPG